MFSKNFVKITQKNLVRHIAGLPLCELYQTSSYFDPKRSLGDKKTHKGPFTNYVIGIWGGGGQSKYYRELMGGRGGPPKKL